MTVRRARWWLAAVLATAPWVPAGAQDFSVSLDDAPIGEHSFRVSGADDARMVEIDARFSVRLLGVTVFRYQHRATETWRGNCLDTLTSTTDDDGEPQRVQAQMRGDALQVTTSAGTTALPGCVMSFAYWNPAIRSQPRLLNAQTGQYEAVQIRKAGTGLVQVRGQSLTAERWRIDGPKQPIDVWYAANGDWVGLDSVVRGGRKLSYRLK